MARDRPQTRGWVNHLMLRLTETDDGREIDVGVGEILELALPETSGTGFSWAFTSRGESILALEKEYYAADAAPGSGRMHCWRLKAIAPGNAMLKLDYARPWEKRASVRSFSVKLRTG